MPRRVQFDDQIPPVTTPPGSCPPKNRSTWAEDVTYTVVFVKPDFGFEGTIRSNNAQTPVSPKTPLVHSSTLVTVPGQIGPSCSTVDLLINGPTASCRLGSFFTRPPSSAFGAGLQHFDIRQYAEIPSFSSAGVTNRWHAPRRPRIHAMRSDSRVIKNVTSCRNFLRPGTERTDPTTTPKFTHTQKPIPRSPFFWCPITSGLQKAAE